MDMSLIDDGEITDNVSIFTHKKANDEIIKRARSLYFPNGPNGFQQWPHQLDRRHRLVSKWQITVRKK